MYLFTFNSIKMSSSILFLNFITYYLSLSVKYLVEIGHVNMLQRKDENYIFRRRHRSGAPSELV